MISNYYLSLLIKDVMSLGLNIIKAAENYEGYEYLIYNNHKFFIATVGYNFQVVEYLESNSELKHEMVDDLNTAVYYLNQLQNDKPK